MKTHDMGARLSASKKAWPQACSFPPCGAGAISHAHQPSREFSLFSLRTAIADSLPSFNAGLVHGMLRVSWILRRSKRDRATWIRISGFTLIQDDDRSMLAQAPAVDHRQQIVDVDRVIIVDIRDALVAGAPAVDHAEQVIDVDDAISCNARLRWRDPTAD